jgi:HPt (histidine-containing phosphotransfer) domain-containing protein
MSGTGDPSVDALLAQVRAQFTASLPSKVVALEQLVARGQWQEARRAAHKLRGSASTYGHIAVGAAAGAIEETLLASSDSPDDDARAGIADRLAEANAAASPAATGEAK